MEKDFNRWNEVKKELYNKNSLILLKEREIWWCHLGLNIGKEQNGDQESFKRPIVVLRVFSRNTCLAAPLTTSKETHEFRFDIGYIEYKKAKAILSQVRVLDTNRLETKIGYVDKGVFEEMKKALKNII